MFNVVEKQHQLNMRGWRNRQTRTFEGRVVTPCGFKSHPSHQQRQMYFLHLFFSQRKLTSPTMKYVFYYFLKFNSGCFALTFVPSSTDDVINVLPPITTFLPITVSPPRIVAPEYIVTLSSIVG